jgi:hypothetical protein
MTAHQSFDRPRAAPQFLGHRRGLATYSGRSAKLPSALWLSLFALLVGCDGCRQQASVDDPSKREAERVTIEPLRSLPADEAGQANFVKPGHWADVNLSIRSNREDARGELTLRATKPADVQTSRRDIGLPKGQQKRFESRIFIPALFKSPNEGEFGLPNNASAPRGVSAMIRDSAGRWEIPTLQSFLEMRPFQYKFVVLTGQNEGKNTRRDQFGFLQLSDWATRLQEDDEESDSFYRIIRPIHDKGVLLPASFSGWTSTAYCLWDDLPKEAVQETQLQAMIDWIHWGGTLIINGPAAIDRLPAELFALAPLGSLKPQQLPAESLLPMIEGWTIPDAKETMTPADVLRGRTSVLGLVGTPQSNSNAVADCGQMIWTRRAGRGQVVMTRFDLTDQWFAQWKSGQGFFHGALMGRPPRIYPTNSVNWRFQPPFDGRETNALLATNVRIWCRDAWISLSDKSLSESTIGGRTGALFEQPRSDQASTELPIAGFRESEGGGVGAWSSSGDAARLAAGMLSEAAGIEIPRIRFVLTSLAIYLALLVPVNYTLFRLFGRLEWAWFAVPLLAIMGVVLVARSAQLDIGFARSRTEISLLELQPNYPRGHLSRFFAIYNSLSNTYQLTLDGGDSVVAPMGDRTQIATTLQLNGVESVDLLDLTVPSNRTDVVRAEQFVPIEGTLRLQGNQLINGTSLDLQHVLVLSRQSDKVQFAMCASLAPDDATTLSFQANDDIWMQWSSNIPETLGAAALVQAAATSVPLREGEVRLVAMTNPIAGLTITPEIQKTVGVTIVLAHIDHGRQAIARRDQNLRPSIRDAAVESLRQGSIDSSVPPLPSQPSQP